jgi:chromosome segregation ATPase
MERIKRLEQLTTDGRLEIALSSFLNDNEGIVEGDKSRTNLATLLQIAEANFKEEKQKVEESTEALMRVGCWIRKLREQGKREGNINCQFMHMLYRLDQEQRGSQEEQDAACFRYNEASKRLKELREAFRDYEAWWCKEKVKFEENRHYWLCRIKTAMLTVPELSKSFRYTLDEVLRCSISSPVTPSP